MRPCDLGSRTLNLSRDTAVEGLRGPAALVVFYHHLIPAIHATWLRPPAPRQNHGNPVAAGETRTQGFHKHKKYLILLRMKMFTSLLLSLGLVAALTAADSVKVGASGDLRIAVVTDAKYKALEVPFQEAFQAALKQQGVEVGVKTKVVSADSAAFNLDNNSSDAVLVFAPRIPKPLMISGLYRLSAELPSKKDHKIFFIYKNANKLSTLFNAAFPVAVNEAKFLEATHASN